VATAQPHFFALAKALAKLSGYRLVAACAEGHAACINSRAMCDAFSLNDLTFVLSGDTMKKILIRFTMTVVVTLTFAAMTAFAQDNTKTIPRHDGKPADMTKPVQVFILLGQSNMVGLGKVKGGEISLEHAVKEKKKYQYLVDDAGDWTERKDVRFVRYMSGKGPLNNEWMTVKGNTLGPEFGIGHPLGNAIDAPVMILKCCIGNRALGWDLLPPGSERSEFVSKDKAGVEKKLVYAG